MSPGEQRRGSTTTLQPIRSVAAFLAGALIGALGGLIGLGGAEFRLPLLIGVFEFAALEAVILNKAVSLLVVASALPFRGGSVPLHHVVESWPIILNLMSGSLLGAWFGAGFAISLSSQTLYRTIAMLLIGIAAVLLFSHNVAGTGALLGGVAQVFAGSLAGFVIGLVASLLGVAGGELLIPTLVLLFGVDIKLAGSLSLAVSLPTMLIGFTRYSRDQSFKVIAQERFFLVAMGLGSVIGSFLGGLLLGFVSESVLLPLLAAILIISAAKIWRHHSR